MSDDISGIGRPPSWQPPTPGGEQPSLPDPRADAHGESSAQGASKHQPDTQRADSHHPDTQRADTHSPQPDAQRGLPRTHARRLGRRGPDLQRTRSVEHVARGTHTVVKIAVGAAAVAFIAALVLFVTRDDTPREADRTTGGASAPTAAPNTGTAAGEALTGAVALNSSTTIPFTVDAGTVSYFAAGPDCSATGLQWIVEDSAGIALASPAVICGDIGRVEFPASGDYQVRVYSDGTGDGGEFSVVREDSRPDRILSIASGESADGDIDLPGAQDIYEFEPAAGTVAYFASGDCASSGLQWVVEDENGAPASGAAVVCNDVGRIDFPASGRYRIRVYSVDGSTGKYQVDWKPSRPDRALTIGSGETASGDIDLPGAQDVYGFDVDAGTVAYFAAAPDCSESDRYWLVEDEAGAAFTSTSVICGDIGRVAFPTAGHFRLRVYSVGGGTGRYDVTWMTSRPDKQRPLVGSDASGTIDLPGSRDIWTFTAAPGQSVTLTADPECDAQDLRWVLEAADGTAVSPPSLMCNDIGTVALPSAGDYQVVVYSDGPLTDDYSFHAAAG